MKKIIDLKRKILRYFYTGICLSYVVFVFQACYGTDRGFDSITVTGKVSSKTTNAPLSDIKISVKTASDRYDKYTTTDSEGSFWVYVSSHASKSYLRFECTDDCPYLSKDTTINVSKNSDIVLDIQLNDK